MKVTYLGQACTLVEVDGRRILVDPWLTEGAYFGSWFHTHLLSDAGVSVEEVVRGPIDYVFLSHEHPDHADPATLRLLPKATPILICRFPTPRFRRHLETLGLENVREIEQGARLDLGDDLTITAFGGAEYPNDSALLIEGEGRRFFNETDCKLPYETLEEIGRKGIDIGFFMFSGATWFPMMYDYPDEERRRHVRRRRGALLKSFIERVRVTRPRYAVPSSGPCTVLDPERLWLNDPEDSIFIDPTEASAALGAAGLAALPLQMVAGDVWDDSAGLERRSPGLAVVDRRRYVEEAAEKSAPIVAEWRRRELPAGDDLGERLEQYFDERIVPLSPTMRQRIGTKLALHVAGPRGGDWTVDFTAPGPHFTRRGTSDDWTYRIEVEDKLLYPFVSGEREFLEDLFLSLRARLARRPDRYNEPLYNFFYDPDPKRLESWYEPNRNPC